MQVRWSTFNKQNQGLLISEDSRISVPDFNASKKHQKWYGMITTIQQIANWERMKVRYKFSQYFLLTSKRGDFHSRNRLREESFNPSISGECKYEIWQGKELFFFKVARVVKSKLAFMEWFFVI